MARWRLISLLVIGLTLFGLVMIGSASVVDAARDFQDKWYYLKLQSMWAVIGLVGFFVASKFPSAKLEKYAAPMFFITLFLLVAVLIPGIGVKLLGARRWINLGFTTFQPAELAKLTMAIYFASLLKKADSFVPFISALGIVCGLIMLEPDLGTTLVIGGMGIVTYFGSNGDMKRFLLLVPAAIGLVMLLIIASPYRAARLKTFFNFSSDPLGSSYHIRQAILSFGLGGFTGQGIGQSRQKYEFLPEVTTDSIFAVIGEELGFVGTVVLVVLFSSLVYHGFEVSKQANSPFLSRLALSISAMVGVQAFINLSAIIALLPLTGIPLPFISYGGSSLVIFLAAMGILVNISKTGKYDR